MALLYHRLVEDEKVEVRARKVDLVRHLDKIISLDSAGWNAHPSSEMTCRHWNKGAGRDVDASNNKITAARRGDCRSCVFGIGNSAGSQRYHDGSIRHDVVTRLVQQSEDANAALMRGEVDRSAP